MRFGISKLKEQAVDSHERMTPSDHFRKMHGWGEGADLMEKKWALGKSVLCEAAEATISREKRRQADWFRESSSAIRPLLQKQAALYKRMA